MHIYMHLHRCLHSDISDRLHVHIVTGPDISSKGQRDVSLTSTVE